MDYSQDKPFESREHIVWEIGYCGKAAMYLTILALVFFVMGIASDLLSMKLLLGATSWLLMAVFAAILSLAPHLHMLLAKHLLGMEVIDKEQKK
jgi:hypothetical protein